MNAPVLRAMQMASLPDEMIVRKQPIHSPDGKTVYQPGERFPWKALGLDPRRVKLLMGYRYLGLPPDWKAPGKPQKAAVEREMKRAQASTGAEPKPKRRRQRKKKQKAPAAKAAAPAKEPSKKDAAPPAEQGGGDAGQAPASE